MKKTIRKFIVFLIMLFIVFSFTKVNSAKALTYSSDRVTFTDDDDFIFQGNSYSIDAYAESIGKNTIHGKAAADDTNHLFLELCHDDAIVNIIPKYYFVNECTELYVGKEYGFFINTYEECSNYISTVLVFDIEYELNVKSTDQRAIISITNLFETNFIAVRKGCSRIEYSTKSEKMGFKFAPRDSDTFSIVGDELYYVMPIKDIYKGYNIDYFYLNNIVVGINLYNTNDLNQSDSNYDIQKDDGIYLNETYYKFKGNVYKGQKIYNFRTYLNSLEEYATENFPSKLKDYATDFFVSKTGPAQIPLEYVLKCVNFGSKMIDFNEDYIDQKQNNYIFEDVDTTDDTYNFSTDYCNKVEIIKQGLPLTRNVLLATKDYSIIYGTDDKIIIELKFNGDLSLNSTLQSIIGLKIVDKRMNVYGEFANENFVKIHDETKNLKQNDLIYVLPKNRAEFNYIPQYSGLFDLYYGNEYTDFYVNGEKISWSNHNIYLEKGKNYVFTLDNKSEQSYYEYFNLKPLEYNSQNIFIKSHDNYICKINKNDCYNELKFNNANIDILNSSFESIKKGDTKGSTICYLDEDYYVVINNDNDFEIEDKLNVKKITIELENCTQYHLNKGNNIFILNTGTRNNFELNVNCNLDMSIYYINNKIFHKHDCTHSNVINYSNKILCVNMYSDNEIDCHISIINNNESLFWYVNDKIINDKVYLYPNKWYSIFLKDGNNNCYPIDENNEYLMRSGDDYLIYNYYSYYDTIENAFHNQSKNSPEKLAIVVLPELDFNTRINHDSNHNNLTFPCLTDYKNYNIIIKGYFYNLSGEKVEDFNAKSNSIEIPYTNKRNVNLKCRIELIKITDCYEYKNYKIQNILHGEFHFDDYLVPAAFGGGDGSRTNPYLICNPYHLSNVKNLQEKTYIDDDLTYCVNGVFKICNNIEIESFNMINAFIGKMYSDDKKITITINNLYSDNSMLCGIFKEIYDSEFDSIKFIIKNEIVSDCNLLGGLCAYASNSKITNCSIECTLINSSDFTKIVGGLIAQADDCIVKDCTSNCNLSGYNIIGGVCGRFSGMIDNCTYNGTILVGNGDWANKVVYVGGIVGQLYGDSYGTCYVSSNSKIKWNFNETNDDKLSPYIGIYIGIKANESSFNYGQYTEYESIINTGNLKSSYSYESGWGFWKKTHTVKLPQKDHISNTYGGVM